MGHGGCTSGAGPPVTSVSVELANFSKRKANALIEGRVAAGGLLNRVGEDEQDGAVE